MSMLTSGVHHEASVGADRFLGTAATGISALTISGSPGRAFEVITISPCESFFPAALERGGTNVGVCVVGITGCGEAAFGCSFV